jgi:hypothetical protein
MDRVSAVTLLGAQCAATVYPTLSGNDLNALLDEIAGSQRWRPTTPYAYGDVIVPTVRNGHAYRCIVAGTSDATEPAWPLYTTPDDRTGTTRPFWHGGLGPYPGSQVGDGATLLWMEDGPDPGADFTRAQVKRATYNAWLRKAAAASADYDGTVGKNTYQRSQVYQHCLDMAQRYVPVAIR